jgi:penicillin-insensitive murein endopeptidase
MKYVFPFLFVLIGCTTEPNEIAESSLKSDFSETSSAEENNELLDFFETHQDDSLLSKCIGSVSNGKLKSGKLLPFHGDNYTYFDSESYLAGRGFTSSMLKDVIVASYDKLASLKPNRKFYLMEMSNKEGGKIAPHRTHQNGLSVDFMMPKLRDGKADYSLDTLGRMHYLLEFDDNGRYEKDSSIQIDFDLIAEHILILDDEARKRGSKIEKLIIKIEYKDELYNTPHGKRLKDRGIYVVRGLSPLINRLHDDHYHVDFKKI